MRKRQKKNKIGTNEKNKEDEDGERVEKVDLLNMNEVGLIIFYISIIIFKKIVYKQ